MKKILSTFLFIFFYFYDYLLQVTISIMPDDEYSLSAFEFSLVSAAFFIGYILPQTQIGGLIDKGYFKKSAVTLVSICVIGLTFFSISHSVPNLIFSRFLMGVGSSCACVIAVYAITNWFSHKYISLLIGTLQLSACLGGIFGQAVLAKMINNLGWHGALNFLLIIGLILFLLYCLSIDVHKSVQKYPYKQSSSGNIFTIMNDRHIIALAISGFVAWCSISVVASTWVIKVLVKKYNIDIYNAAHLTIPVWLGLGLGSYIIMFISNYLQSRKKTIYFFFTAQFIGYFYLIFANNNNLLILEFMMFTIGMAASVQTLSLTMISELKNHEFMAKKLALINLIAALSGGVVNPILGLIIGWSGSLQHSLLFLPCLSLLGIHITHTYMTETYDNSAFGETKSQILTKAH